MDRVSFLLISVMMVKLNWMFLFVLTLSPSSLQSMFSFPASSISALSFQMLMSLPLICEKKGPFVCNAVSYIHTSWRYLVFALGRILCFSSLKITINPFDSSLYFSVLFTLIFHVNWNTFPVATRNYYCRDSFHLIAPQVICMKVESWREVPTHFLNLF